MISEFNTLLVQIPAESVVSRNNRNFITPEQHPTAATDIKFLLLKNKKRNNRTLDTLINDPNALLVELTVLVGIIDFTETGQHCQPQTSRLHR